jgi:hypothetical protein
MERPSRHPGARARCPARRLLSGALAGAAAFGLGFSAHAGESLASPRRLQARPSLPPEEPFNPPLWKRHVEIGGEAALVMRLASHDQDGTPNDIRYAPSIGYGFHARVELYRYLRFSAWFLRAEHDVRLVPGAFGIQGKFTLPPVETMVFGARLSPTLPLTSRARSWLTLGVGWGRMYVGRAQVVEETGSEPFAIRERAGTFVEFPLGLGVSFDIIPRWLAIEIQSTGAFIVRQSGEAHESVQAIDAGGKRRSIGPFPVYDASFVHTLGVSILL